MMSGQLLNGRFITSVYSWQQFDTVGVSKKFARGFQTAMFDVAQGDFSLHAHFQGAVMLQHQLDELPDYRLYYGYARWRNIGDVADLSLGRLPFFAGVGSGTIDGALANIRFCDNTTRLNLYGGSSVAPDLAVKKWGPFNKNFAIGGQVLTTALQDWRFGVSYMNRQRERAGYWTTLRPDTIFLDPEQTKEQYASADVSYWFSEANLHARYDYNVDFKKTQRAQLNAKYVPADDWILSADYIHRAPRVPFNSFFAVFNIPASDEVEGGVDYSWMRFMRVFVRGAYVRYTNDQSFRYTVGAAHDFFSVSYRGGTGYAGELNSVSLQGSYPLCERMCIPTVGASFISYKLNPTDDTEKTIAASHGVIARPLQMLSVDVQGQWLNNKVYKNDVRIYAGVNLWISHQLNMFE
jgi:hypothetical protein